MAPFVLGLVMPAAGWLGWVEGGWAVFLQWIGFVPLITGIVRGRPIYALLGARTNAVPAQ